MRKPRALQPGEPVRIVAPSSPFEHDALEAGLVVLAGLGVEPVLSEGARRRDGYLAGSDARRAREFIAAMTGEAAPGIMPARGGYGAMRILHALEPVASSMAAKLFMGFSDATALHLLLNRAADLVTFHGPNVTGLAKADAGTLERTRATLLGLDRDANFRWAGLKTLTGGRATGRVVAGNLSLVAAMIGTPWAAALEGAILVLEDVGEPPYRIDRMLTQIAMQPGAAGLAGLVFGDLGVAESGRANLDRAVHRFTEAIRRPAVARFPIGHGPVNHPVPEGVMAELDADGGSLRVVEDPYSP